MLGKCLGGAQTSRSYLRRAAPREPRTESARGARGGPGGLGRWLWVLQAAQEPSMAAHWALETRWDQL